MVKLSFIIPVFNVDKYISVTLDSILNNDFDFEYEIIVVNDGSTDNSKQVVLSYVEKYDNIVLINNTNQGVSYSRNCGIEHAKGKYVTFVDGDDTINTDTYAHMVEQMEKNAYDFVQCNFAIVDSQGNKRYIQYCNTTTEIVDVIDYWELFFSTNKLIHNSCCTKIINREFISNIRFDEKLSVAEDQKFVFDLLCNAKKILLMNDMGYVYYQRGNSAVHTMSIEKCKNKLTALQAIANQCNNVEAQKYVRYQKVLALIELYNLMVKEDHVNCKAVEGEIKKTVNDDIHRMLRRKEKIKCLMICRISFVYKTLLRLLN